jgi:hypothetical protein
MIKLTETREITPYLWCIARGAVSLFRLLLLLSLRSLRFLSALGHPCIVFGRPPARRRTSRSRTAPSTVTRKQV